MSRTADFSQYSFNPDKLREAGIKIIESMKAEDEESAKDHADYKQPDRAADTKMQHLQKMLEDIFISTGGHIEVDGVRTPIYTPKDNRVLLFFDTIHSFAEEKSYDATQLSRLSGAFGGRISDIKNFIDDARADVAASSKDFTKRLMQWLIRESGINCESYLADITSSKAIDEDRASIFDKIRGESAFEKFLSATTHAKPREIAGTTGHIRNATARPLQIQEERNRAPIS